MERKLIAIMAADVVGYSQLMEHNEEGTIDLFNQMLAHVIKPSISKNAGTIVKLMGDGVLAQFASAIDAVKSAMEIQKSMTAGDQAFQMRIGLHAGDVVVTDNDILGDSVNIAARLEALADPGGILISQQIQDQITHHKIAQVQSLGARRVKNITRPITIFKVVLGEDVSSQSAGLGFDEFTLDPVSFRLSRGNQPVHVEPMVFDLLSFIIANTERIVSREELIDNIWDGRIVSDATVASCIKSARKALGDDGETQKYIRTIRGRGIQFIGDLHQLDSQNFASNHSNIVASGFATQPTLAVLPFRVPQNDPGLADLGDGLAENLSTILTRIPLLSILSRSSSLNLDGKNLNTREIGQHLGAHYLLEGSLQALNDKVRVNVQLVDTENGVEVWAQHFEKPESQDQLEAFLLDILQRVEPRLTQSMLGKLQGPNDQHTAAQLLMKAVGLLAIKGWHRKTFEEAADILRKSISLDPERALAHAHLALVLALGHRVGALSQSEEVVKEAVLEAETALEQNSEDSIVVGLAGCALADVGQLTRSVPLLKKSIELNPENPQAWVALGSTYALLGDSTDAIDALEHGIKIAPLDTRLAVWGAVLSLLHLRNGDLQSAISCAEHACQSDDKNHLPLLAFTVISLVQADNKKAVLAYQDVLRTKPDITQREIDCFVGRKFGAKVKNLQEQLPAAH